MPKPNPEQELIEQEVEKNCRGSVEHQLREIVESWSPDVSDIRTMEIIFDVVQQMLQEESTASCAAVSRANLRCIAIKDHLNIALGLVGDFEREIKGTIENLIGESK